MHENDFTSLEKHVYICEGLITFHEQFMQINTSTKSSHTLYCNCTQIRIKGSSLFQGLEELKNMKIRLNIMFSLKDGTTESLSQVNISQLVVI